MTARRHGESLTGGDARKCARWSISRRRCVALLTAAPLFAGVRAAYGNEDAFVRLPKALWVWKDRILQPDELDSFASRYGFWTIFLYTTPTAAESLLTGNRAAQEVLLRLKEHGCRVLATAGESEWSSGADRLPRHVELLIRLQSLTPRLFDGIHLDVEPNALSEWQSPLGRNKLITTTLRFYDQVRRHAGDLYLDAAVNPVFASLKTSDGRNFLKELSSRVSSVSIMAYRNRIDRTIAWASPAIRQVNLARRRWRIGVDVNKNEPEAHISWAGRPKQEFLTGMAQLNASLQTQSPGKLYTGLAFQSFDGIKAMLEG